MRGRTQRRSRRKECRNKWNTWSLKLSARKHWFLSNVIVETEEALPVQSEAGKTDSMAVPVALLLQVTVVAAVGSEPSPRMQVLSR